MDLYLFCLGLSFGGLLVIALGGLMQQSHHGGHGTGHHGNGAKAHLPVLKFHKAAPSAASVRTHAPGHHHGRAPHPALLFGHFHDAGLFILSLLSPRTFLSILLGFGATGLILRPLAVWPPTLLLLVAAIGGWAFEHFVVRPLWEFLFGFASTPARMLETCVDEESTAATDFDASGHGLVAIEFDGQVRQLLGRLCPEERVAATTVAGRVRTGERLFIRSVDDRRNTCTVSRQRPY